MEPSELSIIPLAWLDPASPELAKLKLPSWISPEVVGLVVQLDRQFGDAVEWFGRDASEVPIRLSQWPAVRRMPNLSGLFAREYEANSAALEAISTAVSHADTAIQHAMHEMYEVIAEARRRLRAFGRRARLVVARLDPVEFEHAELTALVLERLGRLNDDLRRIRADADERVLVYAFPIERWIETVRALGPPRSREQQLADHEHRVRRVLELEPRLATGTATIPQSLRAAMRAGRGILVGEFHDDPEARQMLVDNIDLLKEEGAGALVIELPQLIYQPWFDEFNAGQGSLADQRRLADRLRSRIVDPSQADPLVGLIATAKSKGLPTYAIDTAIRSQFAYNTLANRSSGSNPFMAGNVERIMAGLPDGAKLVALVGASHTDAIGGVEGILGPDFISVDMSWGEDVDPGQAIISPWDGQHHTPWTPSYAELQFSAWYNQNSTIVVDPR